MVPFNIMEMALASMEVMLEMAKSGLMASISDAGVGALCARTAVRGAYLNVRINVKDMEAPEFVSDILKRAEAIDNNATIIEKEILALVDNGL